MFITVMSSLCFFFKQKTAYELRISDWSSDVCSSDLGVSSRVATEAPSRTAGTAQSSASAAAPAMAPANPARKRSEERRVGKECVSTSRSRRSPQHENKKLKCASKSDTQTQTVKRTSHELM